MQLLYSLVKLKKYSVNIKIIEIILFTPITKKTVPISHASLLSVLDSTFSCSFGEKESKVLKLRQGVIVMGKKEFFHTEDRCFVSRV